MTEQELSKKVDAIEKDMSPSSFGHLIVPHKVDGWHVLMSLLLLALLIVFAVILSPVVIFFFFILGIAVYSVAALIFAPSASNSLAFWERFVLSYCASVGELSKPSRYFARRIKRIYGSGEARHLLPHRLAARLMDTYNKQSISLLQIEARLQEVNKYYEPLRERLDELKLLDGTNESGERSLRELEEDRRELLLLQRKIEASSCHLETILDNVESELQKRVLHREVTQLANAASRASAGDPTESMVSDNAYSLEQQITSEVTHYLQMEREIEQRLR